MREIYKAPCLNKVNKNYGKIVLWWKLPKTHRILTCDHSTVWNIVWFIIAKLKLKLTTVIPSISGRGIFYN